jgi:hypothetical protein
MSVALRTNIQNLLDHIETFLKTFYTIKGTSFNGTENPALDKRFVGKLKTEDYIYVMELKLDGSADEALKQIDDKGYAEPFAKDGRTLYKIGVNFSSETRGIKEWKSISL